MKKEDNIFIQILQETADQKNQDKAFDQLTKGLVELGRIRNVGDTDTPPHEITDERVKDRKENLKKAKGNNYDPELDARLEAVELFEEMQKIHKGEIEYTQDVAVKFATKTEALIGKVNNLSDQEALMKESVPMLADMAKLQEAFEKSANEFKQQSGISPELLEAAKKAAKGVGKTTMEPDSGFNSPTGRQSPEQPKDRRM